MKPKTPLRSVRRGLRVCFKHQVAQHLCQCSSPDQAEVSNKIRLPKRGSKRRWAALRRYVAELTRIGLLWQRHNELWLAGRREEARAVAPPPLGRTFSGYRF